MKKFIGKILVVLLALACVLATGCAKSGELSGEMRIGSLVGPTGMGLIDLKDNENIDLQLYQSPTDVVQKLLSGDLDVACVPSNLGAVLYAKTKGNIRVLTTVVNGVLYVVENGDSVKSLKDLKGKTIFASGKGGTPEYVLQALLEKQAKLKLGKDVEIKWLDNHGDVAQKIATTPNSVGLLPEPQVSALSTKSKKVNIALDLNKEWNAYSGQELPMGILIAKSEFVEQNNKDIDTLLELTAKSVENVNTGSDEVAQKNVDAGIVPDLNICKAVIPNCSIVCLNAEDSKNILSTFYQKLFEIEKTSIGGKVPNDDIYFGIKE